MGFDANIGHRQQPELLVRQPAGAQRGCHFREWIAGSQHLSPNQMGADVAVTESEPARLHAVGPKLLHDPPALISPTPAAYRIVSRSGQIRRPCMVMSSAVLPITVRSAAG